MGERIELDSAATQARRIFKCWNELRKSFRGRQWGGGQCDSAICVCEPSLTKVRLMPFLKTERAYLDDYLSKEWLQDP